jgi:hypothetical protein
VLLQVMPQHAQLTKQLGNQTGLCCVCLSCQRSLSRLPQGRRVAWSAGTAHLPYWQLVATAAAAAAATTFTAAAVASSVLGAAITSFPIDAPVMFTLFSTAAAQAPGSR